MIKLNLNWAGWELVALELRQSGLTPQETCREVATRKYNDVTKYNTVKGWYKRTFKDWPAEEKAGTNEEPQCQTCKPRQQNSRVNPKTPEILSSALPEHNYSQNQHVQKTPPSSSWPRPHEDSLQPAGQATKELCAVLHHRSHSHQNQASSTPLQSPYVDHLGIFQQGKNQNLPNHPAQQFWSTDLNLQCHRDVQRFEPIGRMDSKIQLKTETEISPNSDYSRFPAGQLELHYPPYYFETPQNDDGKYLASYDCLPESIEEFEKLKVDTLSSDSYSENVDRRFDENVILFKDIEHSTTQNAKVPSQYFLLSDGKIDSLPHLNYCDAHDSTVQLSDANQINNQIDDPNHGYQIHLSEEPLEHINSDKNKYDSNAELQNQTALLQYPPSIDALIDFGIVLKDPNQESSLLFRRKRSRMAEAEFAEYSISRARKRRRGQLDNNNSVPITIPQDQQESTIFKSKPAVLDNTRNALAEVERNKNNSSIPLIQPSYRHFDSVVCDSIRSSFNGLNMTDDPNIESDYKDVENGFVDVEVKAKWRLRRSLIESRD